MAGLSAQFPWNLGGDPSSGATLNEASATPRLAEYLKGKPKVEALLDAMGERFVTLAAVGSDLDTMRQVANAADAQLDVVGAIVGQAREGADDATYYRRIRARILANRSSGTVEEIYDVLALVLPVGAAFTVVDAFPAGFDATLTSSALSEVDAYRVTGFIAAVRASGVRGLFYWRSADVPHTFTLDSSTPTQYLDAGQFSNAALYPGA